MARLEAGNLKGAVGNIVFYTVDGKTYAKTKPGKRNKKRNATQSPQVSFFKTASTYGTALLMQLKPRLLFPFKRKTYNLFRGWLSDTLKEYSHNPVWEVSVAGTRLYNLNGQADLRDALQVIPAVTVTAGNAVKLSFPSFIPANQVKAPAGTAQVNIQVLAVAAPFSDNRTTCVIHTDVYTVPFNKTATSEKEFVLETGGNTGDMLFIIIGLAYTAISPKINLQEAKWLPAAVVAAGRL